jgi:hypothetical protein
VGDSECESKTSATNVCFRDILYQLIHARDSSACEGLTSFLPHDGATQGKLDPLMPETALPDKAQRIMGASAFSSSQAQQSAHISPQNFFDTLLAEWQEPALTMHPVQALDSKHLLRLSDDLQTSNLPFIQKFQDHEAISEMQATMTGDYNLLGAGFEQLAWKDQGFLAQEALATQWVNAPPAFEYARRSLI